MFQDKALSKNIALIYQAGKVRLGFLIMACTLAGIAVSPSSPLSAMEIFALAVYVLVASSTSGAFNQWYERDIDAVMDRTKDRPFVTKELEPTKKVLLKKNGYIDDFFKCKRIQIVKSFITNA